MISFLWLCSSLFAKPDLDTSNSPSLSCHKLKMLGVLQSSDICLEESPSQHMMQFLRSKTLSIDETIPPQLQQYLYHYYMMVQPTKKVHIRMVESDGPRKVWLEENRIYFGQNAVEDLINQSAFTYKKDSSEMAEVSYNHTLFVQLNAIFLDYSQTAELIFRLYGLGIHDGSEDQFQAFSLHELHSILENLTSLPPHILHQLHLRELAKSSGHKRLFHAGREASAIYNPRNQRITISSNFLETRTSQWTSTLLHELGHALWMNTPEQLKKEYTGLSFQERFPLSNWNTKPNACFITSYATKSPEEDFAEHFAAFIEEPELLKSRCPSKYNMMQEEVFKDTRYSSQAHKKAKLFVDSQSPDSDPAIFTHPISDSIRVEMRVKDKHSMELSMQAIGLYDTHSGVEELCLRFENSLGEVIQEYLRTEDLINERTGRYERKVTIPREMYGVSTMKLVSVISTDRAKNVAVHSIDKEQTISVPGTKGELSPHPNEPLESQYKDIQQRFVERIHGEAVFDITIPVGRHEGLHRVTLDWDGENRESKISMYKSDSNYGKETYRFTKFKHNGKPFVRVRIHFPKNLISGTYWLTKVELEYEKKSGFVAHNSTIHLPFQGHSSLALSLDNEQKDTTIATMDENGLQLSTMNHDTPNPKGGEKSIVLQVPIKGVDVGELGTQIYVRAPSGKVLSWYLHSGMESVQQNKNDFTFVLPLDVHHEKGTYILEEIEIEEEYRLEHRVSNQVVFQSRNHKTKIRFKERGIHKRIQISNHASQQEHF